MAAGRRWCAAPALARPPGLRHRGEGPHNSRGALASRRVTEVRDDFTARGLKEAKAKLDVMQLPKAERRACERRKEDLHYQAGLVLSNLAP
jgi:hypothetical protein